MRGEEGHYARCKAQFDREYLIELMDDHSFSIADAASFSCLSRSGLYKMLRKHGITREVVWEAKRSRAHG